MKADPHNRKGNSRNQLLAIIQLVYDDVHAALWASLCVGALYFVVVIAPALPAAQAQYEAQKNQTISAESRYYCEKWGMPAGTHRHVLCTLDLQKIRSNVERRAAADALF